MKTFQRALAPLLITGSFFSLSLLEYPIGQPRPYLTCLYFLTTWSIFAYFYYYVLCNSNLLDVYTSWPYVVIMICAAMSIFVNLFCFKELKMCLHKLSIVDDTLETLGTSKKYQRLHKWIIQIIFGWIALALSMNAFNIFWLCYIEFSIISIFLPFLVNHMLIVNTLSGAIWGTILRYVTSRFQQVNQHIHVLYANMFEDNIDCTKRQNRPILITQRKTVAKECKRYMWIIMHIHLQLCLISRELNKIFSVQMSVQMASYFAFTIALCRSIYTTYIDTTYPTFGYVLDIILYSIWVIIYNIVFLTLNHICQSVCYKANETIVILSKLSNNNLDENLREQVLQFILQIKQREIKFGLGLYFGYDFIRQYYKSIVTISVIIIQTRNVYIILDE